MIALQPFVVLGCVKEMDRVRVSFHGRSRDVVLYLGYICKKARTVANGLSAGLFVPIILEAICFSHSLLFEFER